MKKTFYAPLTKEDKAGILKAITDEIQATSKKIGRALTSLELTFAKERVMDQLCFHITTLAGLKTKWSMESDSVPVLVSMNAESEEGLVFYKDTVEWVAVDARGVPDNGSYFPLDEFNRMAVEEVFASARTAAYYITESILMVK